jgi:hypothetical protein
MRIFRFGLGLLAVVALAALFCGEAGRARAPSPAKPATARAAGAQTQANLAQVMRGILFPNVNVIYAAQNQDPATIKPEADPSTSPNPLTSMFGGWQAVEDSGLALAESARLLTVPGRLCSNGKPVPAQNADWIKFVQGLRAAGLATYKAGQSKSADAIGDASDKVTVACMNCHDVYREKTDAQGGLAARCTK